MRHGLGNMAPCQALAKFYIHFDGDSCAEPNAWTVGEEDEAYLFSPISREEAVRQSPQLMRHLADTGL